MSAWLSRDEHPGSVTASRASASARPLPPAFRLQPSLIRVDVTDLNHQRAVGRRAVEVHVANEAGVFELNNRLAIVNHGSEFDG